MRKYFYAAERPVPAAVEFGQQRAPFGVKGLADVAADQHHAGARQYAEVVGAVILKSPQHVGRVFFEKPHDLLPPREPVRDRLRRRHVVPADENAGQNERRARRQHEIPVVPYGRHRRVQQNAEADELQDSPHDGHVQKADRHQKAGHDGDRQSAAQHLQRAHDVAARKRAADTHQQQKHRDEDVMSPEPQRRILKRRAELFERAHKTAGRVPVGKIVPQFGQIEGEVVEQHGDDRDAPERVQLPDTAARFSQKRLHLL